MRKADYAFLAASIKQRIETATANFAMWKSDPVNAEYWRGSLEAIEELAYKFATCASVDHDTFLKACGLEP